MNENILLDDLIDDTVGLEVDFAIVRDPDAIQLRWYMSTVGELRKAQTQRLQLFKEVGSVLWRIVKRDVLIDVNQVVLGVFDDPNAVALHPA